MRSPGEYYLEIKEYTDNLNFKDFKENENVHSMMIRLHFNDLRALASLIIVYSFGYGTEKNEELVKKYKEMLKEEVFNLGHSFEFEFKDYDEDDDFYNLIKSATKYGDEAILQKAADYYVNRGNEIKKESRPKCNKVSKFYYMQAIECLEMLSDYEDNHDAMFQIYKIYSKYLPSTDKDIIYDYLKLSALVDKNPEAIKKYENFKNRIEPETLNELNYRIDKRIEKETRDVERHKKVPFDYDCIIVDY